jgi:signal transduction histidine kinase
LLAAGVAHEVNTPLTGISSFTQMLLEGADTEALSHEYVYYDPIYTLPQTGQDWWREHGGLENAHAAAVAKAASSRQASIDQLV